MLGSCGAHLGLGVCVLGSCGLGSYGTHLGLYPPRGRADVVIVRVVRIVGILVIVEIVIWLVAASQLDNVRCRSAN
ncbi:MAG TPA: hypothetical protein VMB51_08740 [Solirubrobacteraceae bacterium]|nr:hypothetical protein [Solirubrobacteraceae bacterium]